MKIVVLNPEQSQEEYHKIYLDKKHKSSFQALDTNRIDKIIGKIHVRNKNWLKNRWVIVCKIKDNSYCLCEDFLKNNDTEIKFIFKNRRKRWMIKNGYIKRNSEIKKEDRDINNWFRKSKWSK